MCLYPRIIPNRKYLVNKKNKGIIPECDDNRKKWVPVGCGKCIECMNQKRRNWQVRMQEEIKNNNKKANYVTITFNEDELEKLETEFKTKDANEIATFAVRRFLERWRRKYKKSITHWLVTELGHENTERLHLHGILFTDEPIKVINERWKYGNVILGDGKGTHYVNAKTINYIVKYVSKIDEDHPGYQSIVLCSPGLGKGYINKIDANKNKYKGEETNETYRLNNGTKIALPIYYRNHIYNEDEREKLWVQKLNKNIRYVMGEKIDMNKKNGEQEYFAALKYYQCINKKMGYGSINWKKNTYRTRKKVLKNLKNKK